MKKNNIEKDIKESCFQIIDNSNQTSRDEDIIKVAQLCRPNYGYYIWPCSLKLTNFIYHNRLNLFNRPSANFLELGCGTSLPSIVARKLSNLGNIYVTDNLDANPELTDLIARSMRLNSIQTNLSIQNHNHSTNDKQISILNLKWAWFDENVFKNIHKIDYLIGSDVFFDSKLYEDLISTVKYLIEFNNPDLVFYTTYQMRSFDSYLKLLYLLEKYSLKHTEIEFNEEYLQERSVELDNSKSTSNNQPPRTSKQTKSSSNPSQFNDRVHEIILFQINK